MEVDMNGNDQSIKEVDMMRSHIPITYVDMTGEGITINKVENNSLLESDDRLLEMVTTLKLEVKLGQLLINFPQLMKMMQKFLLNIKTNQVTNVCKVNIVNAKDFDEVIPIIQV
jgi:hypothetical protein